MSHPAQRLIAVVTGAARGVGRGIALELAGLGATVYATDRDSRARRTSSLPGTVDDTADQVDRRGGRGIPCAVDHTDDAAVAAVFERVRVDHGGLDVLVCNAFDGNALPFHGGPFWELSIDNWRNMFDSGVRSHLVAAALAAPLLIARGKGLIVLTGYADRSAVIADHLYYDLAMHAISRLGHSIAHDLRPHGVTAMVVCPGFTRTEGIVAALGPSPAGTDSILFPGRAVRALVTDAAVDRHSGRTVSVAELARDYGFSDDDPAADAALGLR